MPSPSRRPLAVVALLPLLSACGETQQARPLTETVPVAAALSAVGVGAVVVLTRWVLREVDRSLPRARLTALLVVGPTAGLAVVVTLAGAAWVALGFRETHVGLLSWEDAVGLTAGLGGAALVLHLLLCAIARAITGGRSGTRAAGRVVLCLVTAVLTPMWVGLVWLPAIVLAFRMREAPLPGATVNRPAARC